MNAAYFRRLERNGDVDQDLAGERVFRRARVSAWARVRDAEHHDVTVLTDFDVASTFKRKSVITEFARTFLCPGRVARAEDDAVTRSRPADREATPYLASAADDSDAHARDRINWAGVTLDGFPHSQTALNERPRA